MPGVLSMPGVSGTGEEKRLRLGALGGYWRETRVTLREAEELVIGEPECSRGAWKDLAKRWRGTADSQENTDGQRAVVI